MVGGPAQSDTMDVPSKWHNGQQYDFVVDVDFEEGVPPKKLAFNRSDNPYNVAERCSKPFCTYCGLLWPELATGSKRWQSLYCCLHKRADACKALTSWKPLCRFLEEEGLPMTYRQQVVDYILNLMGRDSALPAAGSPNVDPFTSSGAYVPGGSSFPAPGGASHRSDPFTSEFAIAQFSFGSPLKLS